MNVFDESYARMMATHLARRKDFDERISRHPSSKVCIHHPSQTLPLDIERSERESNVQEVDLTVHYQACALCERERKYVQESKRLHKQNVPSNLLSATFENFDPHDEQQATHRESVREFVRNRKGFLILLGDIGTGKSHLAVAAMRAFRTAWFIKQSTLLLKLRASYQSHQTSELIAEAQQKELLILDEMGLSSGGRDEFPMLHEILDYRHGERLPTILTGNLNWDELKVIIGDRLADRLRQSAFKVLTFSGPSQRSARRDEYFS